MDFGFKWEKYFVVFTEDASIMTRTILRFIWEVKKQSETFTELYSLRIFSASAWAKMGDELNKFLSDVSKIIKFVKRQGTCIIFCIQCIEILNYETLLYVVNNIYITLYKRDRDMLLLFSGLEKV